MYEFPSWMFPSMPWMKRVHAAEPVREVLALLPDEAQLMAVAREDIGLDEHAARTTAGVEDDALGRFQHRNESPDDARWREILAASLPLRVGELPDEVLVDLSDEVLAAMILAED